MLFPAVVPAFVSPVLLELKKNVFDASAAPVNATDDAVGVTAAPEEPARKENTSEEHPQEEHWYIAIVGHRTERLCSRLLSELGYVNYVATQWETRRRSTGGKRRVERVVLPARIFVKTTEQERLRHVVKLPFIFRFVTDRARKETPDSWAPVAVIPDAELEKFRRMLGQEEMPVLFDSGISFAAGDKVRVTAGKLAGMEGTVVRSNEAKRRLYVSLSILGSAYVEIDKNYLEPLNA